MVSPVLATHLRAVPLNDAIGGSPDLNKGRGQDSKKTHDSNICWGVRYMWSSPIIANTIVLGKLQSLTHYFPTILPGSVAAMISPEYWLSKQGFP